MAPTDPTTPGAPVIKKLVIVLAVVALGGLVAKLVGGK
jgi:hypothetical protein